MKNSKLILVLSLCLIVCQIAKAQEETKKVLFIGNSYTAVNDLPNMVQQVAASVGDRIDYQSNTPGGCTFQQHCGNQSMTLIRQGNWDVVVLQEQSQLPSFPQGQVEQECFPYAEQLINAVYEANPNGEAMLYMTWGRENGDRDNAQDFPVLGTYEGMDSMLYERYMYMARTYDASVCPVGRVWRYLRTNHQDIHLYDGDGSHPSVAGTYAAACAFYTMIFHRSPLQITYFPQIEERQARVIREAVQTVVFDTLSFWLRQQQDTTHTDTTQTDTTHTDTTHTDTTTLGIHWPLNGDTETLIRVYPNPATSYTAIQTSGTAKLSDATLCDTKGRSIRHHRIDGTKTSLPLEGLPAGIYTLTVRTDKGIRSIPLVKQ